MKHLDQAIDGVATNVTTENKVVRTGRTKALGVICILVLT